MIYHTPHRRRLFRPHHHELSGGERSNENDGGMTSNISHKCKDEVGVGPEVGAVAGGLCLEA